MNFWEACQAMDEGHTVRMCVNPERDFRLAKDGEHYVSHVIDAPWAERDEEWGPAVFYTRHIRGEWKVVA